MLGLEAHRKLIQTFGKFALVNVASSSRDSRSTLLVRESS
jgi:hypothetical protein